MAKLIVHGADRAQALDRAAAAVAGFTIVGPKSNLAFHAELLANPEFRLGRLRHRHRRSDAGVTGAQATELPGRPGVLFAGRSGLGRFAFGPPT